MCNFGFFSEEAHSGGRLKITAALGAKVEATAVYFFSVMLKKNRMTAYIADLSECGKGDFRRFPLPLRWGLGVFVFQALLSGAGSADGGAVMLLMICSLVFEKPLTIDMMTAAR